MVNKGFDPTRMDKAMNIYISLPPENPNGYLNGKRCSWDQITYFVYNSILAKFPNNTIYTNWKNGPTEEFVLPKNDIQMTNKDVFISARPSYQLKKFPERSIIIDNDNFDVNKWKHGKFSKYGIESNTYPTHQSLLEGLYGAIFKTNDVAIRKWNSDNIDVLETKQFLVSNVKNVELVPHPIDKRYFSAFYNRDLRLSKLKMLICNRGGKDAGGKNAEQLIDMLKSNFDSASYSVIDHVYKSDRAVREILSNFAYLAHTSYSEGFPYFANEFLCQGLPLFGHEEWWEPYGHDILKWTYDPARQDQNLSNLNRLLSDEFKDEYYKMRQELVQTHLDRKDNNWNFLTDKLITMVETLADSR
jgi:hypothetical protein